MRCRRGGDDTNNAADVFLAHHGCAASAVKSLVVALQRQLLPSTSGCDGTVAVKIVSSCTVVSAISHLLSKAKALEEIASGGTAIVNTYKHMVLPVVRSVQIFVLNVKKP